MPRFAANLTLLFAEYPFLDRFEAAAQAGFEAVEFLFPYGFDATEIRARLDAHGLTLVLHNLPAGDWAAGDRGMACDPGRVAEFRRSVQAALACAAVLGTPQINCLAGLLPTGVSAAEARRTLVANVRHAAQQLGAHGIRLMLEPINTFDMPGFFLNRTEQALDILAEVDSPNAFIQFDIYHAQRMEGELSATLKRLMQPRSAAGPAWLGHVQLADNPGRHEPGSGEINFRHLFDVLDGLAYTGHVGCEYRPADDGPGGTLAGLGWLQAHGQHLAGRAAGAAQ